MKPKPGQLTLVDGVVHKDGPYRGEVREGKLHVSHVSDPEHTIAELDHGDNPEKALNDWHNTVKGTYR